MVSVPAIEIRGHLKFWIFFFFLNLESYINSTLQKVGGGRGGMHKDFILFHN